MRPSILYKMDGPNMTAQHRGIRSIRPLDTSWERYTCLFQVDDVEPSDVEIGAQYDAVNLDLPSCNKMEGPIYQLFHHAIFTTS